MPNFKSKNKNVPVDEKLWAEVQALAKGERKKPVVRGKKSVNPVNEGKGFTTFPSAYANGWALSQYKRLGGKWKKESKKAGLIIPPKHIVDKATKIMRAGFAATWVWLQYKVDSVPKYPLTLEIISDYEEALDNLEIVHTNRESTNEELDTALSIANTSTQFVFNLIEKYFVPLNLRAMSILLPKMSASSVREDPKAIKHILKIRSDLISDLKNNIPERLVHISEKSRRLYESEAKKVKLFDKYKKDSHGGRSWVLQTKELGKIQLEIRETEIKGALGFYRYEDNRHKIVVLVYPKKTGLSEKELNKITDYVRHELIHAMQKQMKLDFNLDQAGNPNKKFDSVHLQHNRKREKEIKSQYAREGLDPNMIQIHALDDTEFYSRLLDEIVEFKRLNVSRSDLNEKTRWWISSRKYFVSLKRFKRDNWKKAVGIFFDAVSSNRKYARKWDKEHCESKTCDEMGFSEKASCRPYKNCYSKEASILLPPPPPIEDLICQLPNLIFQYENRHNSERLQTYLDECFWKVFDAVLTSNGHGSIGLEIKGLGESLVPLILSLKDHFNLLRPNQLADMCGIPFKCDYLETAQTPSYPSGHTTQAYYIAHVLSDKYPQLRDKFFEVAKMVEESRIDRGVHFISDNEAAKRLAKNLYQDLALRQSSSRVAHRYLKLSSIPHKFEEVDLNYHTRHEGLDVLFFLNLQMQEDDGTVWGGEELGCIQGAVYEWGSRYNFDSPCDYDIGVLKEKAGYSPNTGIYLAFVSESEIYEDYLGQRLGDHLYLGFIRHIWDELKKPFVFAPHYCVPNGNTNPTARKLWSRLTSKYPSSGNCVLISSRP